MMTCELMLAAALLAPGQQPKKPTEATDTVNFTIASGGGQAGGRPVDEQIEVMRALLLRKLSGNAAKLSGNAAGGATTGIPVGSNPFTGTVAISGAASSGTVQPFNYYFTTPMADSPAAEGAYLDGYGVVFTVTLPMTGRDPRPGAAAPKEAASLSEWERTLKALNGEVAPEKSSAPKTPSVGDILLTMLAENGKHFTALKDDERVTMALTFRGSVCKPPFAAAKSETVHLGGITASNTASSGAAALPEPQSARDHEILGDLHLKQRQAQAAIDAYRKATELANKEWNPNDAETPAAKLAIGRMADLYSKLAQAEVAAGKPTEARRLLEKIEDLRVLAQIKPPTPAPAVRAAISRPGRLTISAPKKLLDQGGNGKISLDEFRKQATVEYVPAGK